jgi:GNAT superfamily N-acetyltransferase
LNAEKPPLSSVEPLAKHHDVSEFDCKKHESLNDWLKRFALKSQQSDSARTYVVHRNNRVVGYYSLCSGSVAREEATERVAKHQPAYPIGIILLARLATDHTEQGQGLGKALLKDALLRASQAADIIGARAVLVHAIDDEARNFYMHFDFEACPLNDLHLMLLMKDLRALMHLAKSDL